MSVAERDLRRLQQELQDALAKGAPDEEIERLMSELRQALDRYLQALAQDMQQNPDREAQPVDPSKVITSRDLQRMLDKARELARSGARDQAREMLRNCRTCWKICAPYSRASSNAARASATDDAYCTRMQRQQQRRPQLPRAASTGPA
jgi:hypothetical protein